MYFNAPKGYGITVVSKLVREDNYLILAFAFCSPKDTFCKAHGKIKCLERIKSYEKLVSGHGIEGDESSITEVAKYIITMPFASVPSIISVGMAYNLLPNKPIRLANSKFNFDLCACIVQ